MALRQHCSEAGEEHIIISDYFPRQFTFGFNKDFKESVRWTAEGPQ